MYLLHLHQQSYLQYQINYKECKYAQKILDLTPSVRIRLTIRNVNGKEYEKIFASAICIRLTIRNVNAKMALTPDDLPECIRLTIRNVNEKIREELRGKFQVLD